jgi:dienelactone hydrolase
MTDPFRYCVHDIPALVVHPEPSARNGRLALWMHYLSGTKEAMNPGLHQLAAAGFTAVSFDAWQHGERALEPTSDLIDRAFSQFRATVWPILGRTVLDAVAVIDHAVGTFELGDDVVAGGISMGGDIAIALAGIDTRISRVAAMIATPDWTRPGMTRLDDPTTEIDQGAPTALGQWLFDNLDPMTHASRYRDRPAIAFDVGGQDRHIPSAHAQAFQERIVRDDLGAAGRIQVRVHPGLDHLTAGRTQAVQDEALGFLAAPPERA